MSRPTRWRDQFYSDMGREGITADTSRLFLRVAATMQRLAEAQCNGDFPAGKGSWRACKRCQRSWLYEGLRKDGVCIDCHNDDKARALAGQYLPGWTIELRGTPISGCVMTLFTPQGREIGVP